MRPSGGPGQGGLKPDARRKGQQSRPGGHQPLGRAWRPYPEEGGTREGEAPAGGVRIQCADLPAKTLEGEAVQTQPRRRKEDQIAPRFPDRNAEATREPPGACVLTECGEGLAITFGLHKDDVPDEAAHRPGNQVGKEARDSLGRAAGVSDHGKHGF